MTPDEQDQVKLIYSEFEKLAHLMDDWAKDFDKDMSSFDKDHKGSVNKPVTTPASAPASGRKDTGSRSPQGWLRNLQEGTSRLPSDPITTDGESNIEIHPDSYVRAGTRAWPADPKTPTFMDTRTPPKPAQTVLPPSRPVPVLPTIVDLTKDIKKPRTPETKEFELNPKNIPQPPSSSQSRPTGKPAQKPAQ